MLHTTGTVKHPDPCEKPSPTAQAELCPSTRRPYQRHRTEPPIGLTTPPSVLDFPPRARIIHP